MKTQPNDPITATLTYNSHTGTPDGHLLGLSKREYFAAMAMQGIIAGMQRIYTSAEVSVEAVKQADALINALNS